MVNLQERADAWRRALGCDIVLVDDAFNIRQEDLRMAVLRPKGGRKAFYDLDARKLFVFTPNIKAGRDTKDFDVAVLRETISQYGYRSLLRDSYQQFCVDLWVGSGNADRSLARYRLAGDMFSADVTPVQGGRFLAERLSSRTYTEETLLHERAASLILSDLRSKGIDIVNASGNLGQTIARAANNHARRNERRRFESVTDRQLTDSICDELERFFPDGKVALRPGLRIPSKAEVDFGFLPEFFNGIESSRLPVRMGLRNLINHMEAHNITTHDLREGNFVGSIKESLAFFRTWSSQEIEAGHGDRTIAFTKLRVAGEGGDGAENLAVTFIGDSEVKKGDASCLSICSVSQRSRSSVFNMLDRIQDISSDDCPIINLDDEFLCNYIAYPVWKAKITPRTVAVQHNASSADARLNHVTNIVKDFLDSKRGKENPTIWQQPPAPKVFRREVDSKWTLLVDADGTPLFDGILFKSVSEPVDGISVGYINPAYVLLDMEKGTLVDGKCYPHLGGMTEDGWALVRENNGRYNYIDRDGNRMSGTGFDMARDFRDGNATVYIANQKVKINPEGIALTVEDIWTKDQNISRHVAPGTHIK